MRPTAAIRALEAGDGRAALDALLAAWRETPAKEIADAISIVGERLGDDVSTSLAAIPNDTAAGALERLESLERLGPDPRVARAVVAWIAEPPFHATSSQPFWKKAFALLVSAPDPSFASMLARAVEAGPKTIKGRTMATWLKNRAREIALPEQTSLPAADAKALEVAVNAFRPKTEQPKRASTEADLLRAIRESPEDDAARAVYADWLLERGDVRGEFIQLQLAHAFRQVTDQEKARELALAKEHGKTWIGEPASVIGRWEYAVSVGLPPDRCSRGVCFDRGFVAAFPLIPPPWGKMTGGKLKKLRGHAAFATVSDFAVNVSYYRNHWDDRWPVADFLSDASLRAMRRVIAPTPLIPLLARGPHAGRITWLETLDYENAVAMNEAIEACGSFPALRVLSVVAVATHESLSSRPATLDAWRAKLPGVEIRVDTDSE